MMDGNKILLQDYQKEKNKKICKECKGSLYRLDDCLIDTYVCSSCGKTYVDNEKNSSDIQNINKIPIFKLFPDTFMKKFTSYENFNDFLLNCKLIKDEIIDDPFYNFEDINQKKWDGYVKKNTAFCSWTEMFEKAIDWYFHM